MLWNNLPPLLYYADDSIAQLGGISMPQTLILS